MLSPAVFYGGSLCALIFVFVQHQVSAVITLPHIFLWSHNILNEWEGIEVKTENSSDSYELHVMGKY